VNKSVKSEICIVGAGPAGLYAALSLAKNNIPSLIIDKEFFPRDKVCGEALPSAVLRLLHKLDPEILKSREFAEAAHTINRVRLYSPNSNSVTIPFKSDANINLGLESAISMRRLDLDNVLMNFAKSNPLITVMEGVRIDDIRFDSNTVLIRSNEHDISIESEMLLIANGYNSRFLKPLGIWDLENEVDACGITAYYSNVEGIADGDVAECYILDELKSGGMYVLPVGKGLVNVNIAIRNDVRKKYNINLRTVLENSLRTHPVLKKRFADAIEVQKPKGHGFHLGVMKREVIGDRFMLIGDAGGFNDAVSANGIAHAMISASYAVESLIEAHAAKDYSAHRLKNYPINVYRSFADVRWQGILSKPILLNPSLLHAIMNRLFAYDGLEDVFVMVMYKKNPWKLLFDADFYRKIFRLSRRPKMRTVEVPVGKIEPVKELV